jgi:chromosomal replication initiation ATPase DnaA
MNEETYAQLLEQSARRTSLALKANKIAEKKSKSFDGFIHVFHEVRENNNHDIEVLLEEFANLSATTIDVLLSRDRTAVIANTRNVLFYVMHKYTGLSNPQIARIFQRDPSTVQTGRVRGKNIVDKNKFLVDVIQDALNKAKTNGGNYGH